MILKSITLESYVYRILTPPLSLWHDIFVHRSLFGQTENVPLQEWNIYALILLITGNSNTTDYTND